MRPWSILLVVFAALLLPGAVVAQDATPAVSPAAAFTFEGQIAAGDGRTLHVACAGTGGPPVLFEPGGPFLDGGTAVVAMFGADLAAALGTRFCSYDRAGSGQSEAHPAGIRTFQEAAADLGAVLASAELGCPCIVVGESLGGSIAQVALATDAAGFAGLVLLDATYPGYFDEFLALAPAGSPEAALEAEPYMVGENEEWLDLVSGFRQVILPAEPPAIPVIVVTHGAGDPPGCFPCSADYPVAAMETTWQAGQAELAEALDGRLVIAEDTGHTIAVENPSLVVSLIAVAIAAVRDPGALATPAARPTA